MKWMLWSVLLSLSMSTSYADEGSKESQEHTVSVENTSKGIEMSPLEVVNKRMSLYNAHDLEGFLAMYSPDIAIYNYPDTFFGSGIDHMRGIFAPLFVPGGVRTEVLSQLVNDSYVINEEIVTYPDREVRYVSIYEVREEKIKSVRFIRD
jgi:hypothetical protein